MTFINLNFKPFHLQNKLAWVALGSCVFLSTGHLPALAQSNAFDPDNPSAQDNLQDQPTQPTPVQEIAPDSENAKIPGTEPLYDKGVTVTQIDITGNKLVPASTILNAIGTKPGSLYSKKHLQDDLKKIYDLGYFTETLRVVPVATREGVHIRYEVEENPVVNDVEFSGATVVKAADLKPFFKSQIGMPQNVNQINQGIQGVEGYYKDKGYILARVDDINEDPPGTLKLAINEGKIDKITFSGEHKTKKFVIRRAMAQKEGQVYNETVVNGDMKRIFSTQAFSDVRRVIKASSSTPGDYDLVIEVDEKKTGAITLGGGVDTATGLFGSIGYNDPNFRGRGDSVSTVFSVGSGVLGSNNVVLSRRLLQFQANYFNPSIGESTTSFGTSVFIRDLASFNVPLAVERRFGGNIDFGRPLQSNPSVSIGMEVGYENINISEGATPAQLAFYGVSPSERARELKDGSYVYLSPTATYDTRNNRFSPTSGWLNTVGDRVAVGVGASSYDTITANLRRYLRVTDSVTLALNAQAGTDVLGSIPDFNQFRLGGAYTIRGYQEGGVGIGKEYVLGSAEVRAKIPLFKAIKQFNLYDLFQVAGFVDAGQLYGQSPSNALYQRPGYGIAYGAGLRLTIPGVGPLRIDYAEPIGHTGGNVEHFNFGVGQKF